MDIRSTLQTLTARIQNGGSLGLTVGQKNALLDGIDTAELFKPLLPNEVQELAKAPAWEDTPNSPGLWVCSHPSHGTQLRDFTRKDFSAFSDRGWSFFGPIPEPRYVS